MISYAAKRIVRGRGLFLALFMSVVLAATLFSGILQGADAVGVSLLDSTLKAANVDVTCTAAEKNVTVTRVYEADMLFGKIDGVKRVDHLIRMKIDLNSSASNVTITSILLVLPDDSDLLKEASGAISLENSKIHIEAASTNATMFPEGETATVSFETYKPYGDLMDFKKLYFNFQVAEPVALDDKNFAIATGRYNEYLLSVLTGTEDVARRPPYQLVLMSESTFKDMLAPIYGELRRRPVDDLANVALITLDRERIINPWDMQGSLDRLTKIYEQLNGEGARYFYVPYIHIADVLDFISSQVSAEIKTSTLLVSIPVFFTAWYLGSTVSDIVLAQRRTGDRSPLHEGADPQADTRHLPLRSVHRQRLRRARRRRPGGINSAPRDSWPERPPGPRLDLPGHAGSLDALQRCPRPPSRLQAVEAGDRDRGRGRPPRVPCRGGEARLVA